MEIRYPTELVTFIIGTEPSKETFLVHKEHACYYSEVLDKAFNSQFIEGQTQTYTMKDEHPGAFRYLVQWLYQQKINNLITGISVAAELTEEGMICAVNRFALQTTDLLRLWILADFLQITR